MSKLPRFVNEQEEAEFWATHDSTEYLDDTELVDVTFVDARPSERQISLHLDAYLIDELKAIAQSKDISYQTLIRMWVMERLAQEHATNYSRPMHPFSSRARGIFPLEGPGEGELSPPPNLPLAERGAGNRKKPPEVLTPGGFSASEDLTGFGNPSASSGQARQV